VIVYACMGGALQLFSNTEVLTKPQYYIPRPNNKNRDTEILKIPNASQ